ncbi:MAG: flavin reductase [Rhizobiales bacterium]|nr:flavin reductase [Hyphomicrobiales bacterium]OJY46994.1 MAG: flavin reductase [Rhizobiales bacterium 64-17]
MISVDPLPQDTRALRDAFSCFPSGVVAVCALSGPTPVGMVASSFTSVSLEPPFVSLCVQKSSNTWPQLRGAGRLGISILAKSQDAACKQLASRNGERFVDIDWEVSDEGAVFLNDAAAWLDCALSREIEAGDHWIVLLELRGVVSRPEINPLVFHASRFRQLVA